MITFQLFIYSIYSFLSLVYLEHLLCIHDWINLALKTARNIKGLHVYMYFTRLQSTNFNIVYSKKIPPWNYFDPRHPKEKSLLCMVLPIAKSNTWMTTLEKQLEGWGLLDFLLE